MQKIKIKIKKPKHLLDYIFDMIKGDESDVADIAFEILAKEESQFFCCILF